jgi:hypothetical protein
VLLDIGGDIGAVVLTMPAHLVDREVEARRTDGSEPPTHVGVVLRPAPTGPRPSAVFAELREGDYQLYLRPDGPVVLAVTVVGGQVVEQVWPHTPGFPG